MTRRLRRCLLVRRKGLELRIATREKPRNRTRNVWTGKNWGEDLFMEGRFLRIPRNTYTQLLLTWKEAWRNGGERLPGLHRKAKPPMRTGNVNTTVNRTVNVNTASDQPFLLTDTNTETKRMWGNYPPWQYLRGLCIQPELHKDVLGSPNWDQERWIRQDWILCSQIGG